jgi:hypothetical protein
MLFIPLFVSLCVKLDPGTHKGMHSIFAKKLGVTVGGGVRPCLTGQWLTAIVAGAPAPRTLAMSPPLANTANGARGKFQDL